MPGLADELRAAKVELVEGRLDDASARLDRLIERQDAVNQRRTRRLIEENRGTRQVNELRVWQIAESLRRSPSFDRKEEVCTISERTGLDETTVRRHIRNGETSGMLKPREHLL